jgi:hypothetical protein
MSFFLHRRVIHCASLLCAIVSASVGAQQSQIAVRIDVRELEGAPIPGVDLTFDEPGHAPFAAGATDAAGVRRLILNIDSTSRVTAKKIGYLSTSRVIIPRGDVVEIRIGLRRMPAASLDTVRVAQAKLLARERAKLPVIDSAEIASASRAIFDIFDIFAKLRPDIGYQHYKCPRGNLAIYVNERRALDKSGLVAIKPDDVEEIRYINCFDKSIAADDRPHEGRFYVTLKPGVRHDQERGSYIPDSTAANRVRHAPSRPGIRRLLVLDGDTHALVPGAIATELKSGRSAATDATGLVPLNFAESTTVILSVRRTGFVPAVVVVRNDVADATPIKVNLMRRGPGPVQAATAARIASLTAADTVAKLVAVEFYTRLNDPTMPGSAFITADQLQRSSSWSTLAESGLRGICLEQLFIDGAPASTDSVSRQVAALESLVRPDMISGVETYIGAEVAKAKAISPTIFVDAERRATSTATESCMSALWTK